ncbi:hypothetical protein ACEPPN_011741 [Leptodophora sp. 'Broadleaf-Isolate-01']
MALYIVLELVALSNFSPRLNLHLKILKKQVGANVEGKLVSEDVGPQTEKTLENIKNILQSAGSSLERVLKVNIYMPEQADYAGMNEVYKRIMPDPKPPRACVFVKGLPGGAKVEIECIAAQD